MSPLIRCVLICGAASALVAQTPVRWAQSSDLSAIPQAIHRLVAAANSWDAQAARAATTNIFDAAGDGWAYNADGIAPWSRLKTESLGKAKLAVVVRHALLLSDEVAAADGSSRTIGLPGGELSGNVTMTLLKCEGRWLVATARFAPIRSSRTISPVKLASNHAAAGPDGWVDLFNGQSMDAFVIPDSDTSSNPGRSRMAI